MKTIWTQHLKTEEEKKDFETVVNNSTYVLGRVKQLIENRERGITSFEGDTNAYDNPSWAYKQAHANGRRAELKELLALFDFIK